MDFAKYFCRLFDTRSNRATLRLTPLAAAVAAVGILISPALTRAQQANEKTFATPGDAALALYTAAKTNDNQALTAILGTNTNDIIHTGDDVADKKMGQEFIARYDQMHRVVLEPDETVTLYVGAENWPLPIPLVKTSGGTWYFDTTTGKVEILQRRIGTNENDAIEVLYGLADAQNDYVQESRDNESTKHYAQKFLSDDGKHNGLYWKTNDSEPPSPIGPLLVQAASEGYTGKQGQNSPFHGYYYRILTKQGAAAKGGALDYIVGGKMTRGFAFLAYPAEYRNSGVMTFIVNKSGVVYEKDLGPQTSDLGAAMQEYNPDDTWSRVD